MLSVSDNFKNAEKADVNQIASKIYLVLGNYANASAFSATVSASSSDASGDYPASGAIDGDRTEINIGPASGADNDLGKSSWRSATAPSVTPQTLTIDFGQSRTINRIKLYHLTSHALKSYKLESSPDNITYTLIGKTTDQGGTIATTNQLDTIDFTEVTCRYVKFTVSDTVVAADKANVVELECYRKVDVTDRILTAKVNRPRDYKLLNPLAATFSLKCDNSDRFFSFSHTPNSSETTAGFVNSELKPNIGIIIQYGFAYGGGTPELATVLNGFVDRIRVNPADRTVTIDGRDLMKALINQIITSKLKTSQDIKACIQYALNLTNVSNWEMSLDTTSLTIDYFFINNQSILTVIRDLVQASADASFYIDESGNAIFKYYVNSTPQSHTDSSQSDFNAGTVKTNIDTDSTPGQISRKWFLIDDFADNNFNSNPSWTSRTGTQSHTDSSQADFEAGTVKTNIDTTSVPNQIGRKWFLIDDFADGNFSSNPVWTSGTPTFLWTITSGALRYVAPGDIGQTAPGFGTGPVLSDGLIYCNSNSVLTGTWRSRFRINNGAGAGSFKLFFINNGPVTGLVGGHVFAHSNFINGYYVKIIQIDAINATLQFGKTDSSGIETIISTIGLNSNNNQFYSLRVARTTAGVVTVFIDEVLKITSTADTSIISSSFFGFNAVDGSSGGVTWATYDFDDIYYSPALDGTGAISTAPAIFESQVIDQGANIFSEGLFQVTDNIPAGCSFAFFTATSTDNITYDAYVSVTPGGAVQSATKRYLKWKAVFTCPIDDGTHNNNFTTPTIQDVTIFWTVTGWQCVSNQLKLNPGISNSLFGIDTNFISIVGTWRANFKMTVGSASGEKSRMYILTTGYDVTQATYLSGYYAELDQAASKIRLSKINSSGSRSTLVEVAQTITTATTYSIRVTRTSAGVLTLFVDEIQVATATDTSFNGGAALAFEVDPNSDQNGNTIVDDIYFSPSVDGTGTITSSQAVFESQVIDLGASIALFGIFQAGIITPTGTSLAFYTATSADGVTFDAYVAVSINSLITSTVHRYLKWKAVFTCPIDDGLNNANLLTPAVTDVTINWFVGSGSNKFPTSVSYTFRFDTALLGISQEYADNLGGDSAIINDVSVQAKPLILSGTNSDTQWQGTTQTPPVPISASAPLAVSNGQTLTYKIVVSNGMDTSFMSGANPAAAAITFAGGGAGSWVISRIHPTRPILVITITGTGNITDLRLIGKSFSNSNTNLVQASQNAASINQYGDRQINISNQYIVNDTISASIASKLVANYKDPTSYIPGASVRPTFSAQLGDRVIVVDENSDISADYVISGIQHIISSDLAQANSQSDLLLSRVTT